MIQLANLTQKDVWICVPHAADDQYIEQMAQLFKSQLDPKLKVYLEYSNEVWNWIFQQAHYNDQNRPNNLSYPRAYAEKAKRVFRIWHNVYGSDKNRVKRVLGIQTLYNSLNEQILAQLPQNEWDFGAPTFYIGLDHSNTGNPVLNQGSTTQDILNNARNAWLLNNAGIKQDYNQIKMFGKGIIAYEGGQHFVGNVFGIPYDYQQAMWDAQKAPEMYQLYDQVLDSIRNWGCQLAGNFSLASEQESVYGSWGVMSDIDVAPPYMQSAPKYQALLDNNCDKSSIPGPKAAFKVDKETGCAPMLVHYTAENPDNNIDEFHWSFPGGTPATSNLPNPTVVYGSAGVYSPQLRVVNSAGQDSLIKTDMITVNALPVANFEGMPFGSIVIFTNDQCPGCTYSWDFGDGKTSNQSNPFHTYSDDGVYAVRLTVANGCGTTKITKEVIVATNPTASFTYSNASGCAPLTVQFTSTSSTNSQQFNWSFPGGTPATSTVQNPVVVFYAPGAFSASLTVKNSIGQNTNTQNSIITTNDVPAAYFNTTVSGATVAFANASIGGGTYTWNGVSLIPESG
jgi:PKD repeat protein